MNTLTTALLGLLCAQFCASQSYIYNRQPQEQPERRKHHHHCPPCPAVFPPLQPTNNQQPTIPQCPCVKPPGSTECATYDRRVQAATLEEALYSFPHLGIRDPSGSPKPLFDETKEAQSLQDTAAKVQPAGFASSVAAPQRFSMIGAPGPEADVAEAPAAPSPALLAGSYSCNSPACKACMLIVVNGFVNAANNSTDQSSLAQFMEMQKRLEVEAGGAQCPGLAQPAVMMQEPAVKVAGFAAAGTAAPVPPDVVAQIVRAIQPDGSAPQRRSITDEEQRQHNGRSKRQSTTPNGGELIGTATKLGCDYQKGTPIGETKFVGLCNICWQWRRLPDKYFPSYLNEVSCDSKDDQCLAGWGKCRPVLRSVNVLINRATKAAPDWQQESLFTVAACECQVETGSPLHTFVAR